MILHEEIYYTHFILQCLKGTLNLPSYMNHAALNFSLYIFKMSLKIWHIKNVVFPLKEIAIHFKKFPFSKKSLYMLLSPPQKV